MAKILIVDDEADIRAAFARYFERAGHEVLQAATGEEGVALARAENPPVILLDLFLPDISGLEVLERTREQAPVVIMITAHGDVPAAVQAMQGGAEGFLTKPVELGHLGAVVDRALEKAQLRALRREHTARNARAAAEMLLGSSAPMRELAEQIDVLARSEQTVALLVGETGVGKSRVARAIHALSSRAARPFQEVECSMRPADALERELFGSESIDDQPPVAGLLEAADGGTLYLDEIADLPAGLQTRLLRVLEKHRMTRGGGSREIAVDVRVIASSIRDLATEVTEQRFREDLYYRLGAMPLHLPPLRARAPGDLRETAVALVSELRRGLPDAPTELSRAALDAIGRYPWPGNIRELRTALERALLHARGEPAIGLEHLPLEVLEAGDGEGRPHVSRTLADVERTHIERTLRAHGANRTRAARELGISRATLIKKIREFGLGDRPAPGAHNGAQER